MGGAWCEKKLETRERDRERDRALSSLFDPRFFVMKVKIKKKKPQVSLVVSVSDSSIIDHTLHPNSRPSSICVLSSHVLKAR